MNLAAILPQGLPLSDACQLVQTTFLGLCCFCATRFFEGVFALEELKKRQFLQENPYFSCSSPSLAYRSKLDFRSRIDASEGSGISRYPAWENPVSKKLVRNFMSNCDIAHWKSV